MNPVLMQLIQRLGPGVARLSESAQATLARSLGLQTPAAQQAASRLMEPGVADKAMTAMRASGPGGTNPLITAGGTAGTALAAGMMPTTNGGAQISPDREALFSQLNRDPDTMARMAAVNRAKEMVNLPEYEGARAPSVMGMPFSDDVRSETPSRPMTGGYTDDGQAAYAAATRKPTPARAVTQAAASPSREDPKSFFGRLFSGPAHQSTGQSVIERPQGPMPGGAPQKAVLNWGDQENAADFFRADQAMRQLQKDKEEFVGRAEGGKVGAGAGGKDAAIHKALEIIHHLLSRR